MGKAHNKALREAKIAKRKAMKEANKRQNDDYKAKKASKKSKTHLTSHPFGKCGNIGCKKCNPNWPA